MKKLTILPFLLTCQIIFCQAPSKTFTEKLEGIKTSSKELTKNASTDNSSIGQSGVMTTSIPLVTVSSRTMSFPLQLNYTSGIKVNQSSGSVGLGWVMPVGSIIRDFGAFEPDYTSTNGEVQMQSSVSGGQTGWLNSSGGDAINPVTHNQFLGYNAVDATAMNMPISDEYHLNVPGFISNTFWNKSTNGAQNHDWSFSEFANWKVNQTVRTFQIAQEFSRINEMNNIICSNCSNKNYFDVNGSFAAAIGVFPYVKNGYASLPSSSSGGFNPPQSDRYVTYEDFESFIITDDQGTQYVFGRPLRGQKFVFSDDPYWSNKENPTAANSANGNFWKIDYIAEWLLTEIRTVDFVDLNNNGIADDGDAGDWIRFEYTSPTKNEQTTLIGGGGTIKMTQEVPSYREWNSYSQTDRASSLMRERAYLTRIITPTQYLDFTISTRMEVEHDYYSKPANKVGNTFYYEDRKYSSSGSTGSSTDFDIVYPVETMKYDSIKVYSKLIDKQLYSNEKTLTGAVALKYAEKGSAQELAVSSYLIRDNNNIDKSSEKPSDTDAFNIESYHNSSIKRGKTTLIGVDLLGSDLKESEKTSYKFDYAYNPSYDEVHKREIVRKYFFPSLRASDYQFPDLKSESLINYTEKTIQPTGHFSTTSLLHTGISPFEFLIDIPHEENCYKYISPTESDLYSLVHGNYINVPTFADPINCPITPVVDVFGFLTSTNSLKCAEAWTLTGITYPTGGKITYEYEQGTFEYANDKDHWSFDNSELPLIKEYNDLAKVRSYIQDGYNKYAENIGAYNGTNFRKTLTATFEVPLPTKYGIRLKRKSLDDRVNPVVVTNYEYSSGHFTSLPAEFLSASLQSFNSFLMKEKHRHNWEIPYYTTAVASSLPGYTTNYSEKMQHVAFSNINIDDYHSQHFYESIKQIQSDQSYILSHYNNSLNDILQSFPHHFVFCSKLPVAGKNGRFIIGGNHLLTSPIHMNRVEYFESGQTLPYKSVEYLYNTDLIFTNELIFNYGNTDNTIELWNNTFENWLPIQGSINPQFYYNLDLFVGYFPTWILADWMNVAGVVKGFAFAYDNDFMEESSYTLTLPGQGYEKWGQIKTRLVKEQVNYKGLITSTEYFYDFSTYSLKREEQNYPSLNTKYITEFEYAHEAYSTLTTKFNDLNLLRVPCRTTTYLNNVDLTSVLSAKMATYDVTSFNVPKSKNSFVYETSIDPASGIFILVPFNLTSSSNPNWRIDQNNNLEYNKHANLISSRTNRLYNKMVYGNNLNLTKATFAYPDYKFDATYSGFEDFHGRHAINDWNAEEYKNETWFSEGGISQPTIKLSLSTADICDNSSSFYKGNPIYDDVYHVVSINNISNVSVDNDIAITFTTNGTTSIFNTKISSIVERQTAIDNFGATSYTLDYVLCFSDAIDFPFTNPSNLGDEDPLLTSNSHTISCEIGSVDYALSKSYSRTGEYSYQLRTKRDDNEMFNQTPIRPVKIYSIAEEGCLVPVPDDPSVKSLALPEYCKWDYEASVWLKYDTDIPKLKPGSSVVSPKSSDAAGDARYIRGEVSETDNGSQVKIICDVYNNTRDVLLDQRIYYVEDLTAEWKQFTVDVTLLKQGNKWLDVYVVNERAQVGQPLSQLRSVFVDDIAIYPKGTKYSYMTVDKFGATTFTVDNNDVYVETIYDAKSRPVAAINHYGTKTKEFEYFELPNWTNQQNHITERTWVDNGLYNQSRYYLDGFGKTKQVITSDQTRGARIVSETNIFNNKGQVVQAYKPYVLKGANLAATYDNTFITKTSQFYGSNYAYVQAGYEPKPEEYLSSVSSPRLNTEGAITKTQSNYLSIAPISNSALGLNYPVGTLMVHQMIDANGSLVRSYVDAMSRVVMEEHQVGQNHIQNADGSISNIASPDTYAQTWFKYDQAGRLIKVHDPEGKETIYTYNSLGVLIKSESPDRGTAELRYDKYGQVRFVRNEKDIQATNNSIYNTDQFKYSKYDVWGRVIESGMIMSAPNTPGLDPANLPFPSGDFFNSQQKIDDQGFPLSTSKLVQVHAQFTYDGSRDQFNSNQMLKEVSLSGHTMNAVYVYTPTSTDKKEYEYMADGQMAKVAYNYQGLTGNHILEPVYNEMRLPVGKTYTHPTESGYNFKWLSEIDNFGRVKINKTIHNGVTTQTGKYYYDVMGNLLMEGLGATGNASNPHVDYVVYKRNIRNQVINQMTKNLRIGLSYDVVGNITNQYWSSEHFDPTTGTTVSVNQYQYYYDKMNRLVGADYKTGSYTQNPFSYFDNISTNFPNDFTCGVNELVVNQLLDPIFDELKNNIRNRTKEDLSRKSMNALNTLKVEYIKNDVSYPTMTEVEKEAFLQKYIEKAESVKSDPIHYEQYMAEKNQDQAHLDLLKTGSFGVFKLKYVKLLVQNMSINEYQPCQPNPSATVFAFLPNFQMPTTTSASNKYDAAYWYSKNGNINTLNRNDEVGVKTQQSYSYSNPTNNQLTGVTWTNLNTSTIVADHLYQYDQTGNLLNDARNGVTAIDYISYNDLPQAITNGGGMKSYRYDNAGQRIVKINSSTDIEFYIDDIIIEYTGEVKSYQTKEGFVTATNSAGSITVDYFYNLKDWLGTNRAVLDATGAIQNAADHYPYGLRMPGRHYVTENEGDRYQFTGHQFDGETNYDYHGARYYNRELGRYMSVDPLAAQFFNWSSYNYTLGNPIMLIDPNGKAPQDWIRREGSKVWEYDSRVQSETGAKTEYGEGTEYMDDGGTYQGSYDGKSVGTITLNTGGLQTWEGGSYQNKDLNPDRNANNVFVKGSESIEYSFFNFPSNNSGLGYYTTAGEAEKVFRYNQQVVSNRLANQMLASMNQAFYAKSYMHSGAASSCDWFWTLFIGWGGGAAATTVNNSSRVFWSGGNIAKSTAANYAKANGLKTLEMTTGGRIMNTINPILPRSVSTPVWNRLSTNFAKGASGEAHFFTIPAGPRSGSIWLNVEKPILQKNNVNIIYH